VTRHPKPSLRASARSIAVAVYFAVAAACGSSTPSVTAPATPSAVVAPTDSPTSPPTLAPTPTATPTETPAPPTPSAAPNTPVDAQTAAKLQTTLDALRSRYRFPGIAVAVILPDGSSWSGRSGVGVLSTKVPLAADTLFSVASISKTFTAALALRLAERGVVSLDDPLSRWVPSFPNAAKISLRELLNHTSGISDFFEPAAYKWIDANHKATWTPAQVLARIGRPYFAPGKGYRYSSTNYILLGMALEKATGEPLAATIRTEFLEPLGLSDTFLQGEEQIPNTLAHGYLSPLTAPKDVSVGQPMIPYVSVATAAGASGGFVSTAADIARWGAALYGGRVLEPASLTAMTDFSASQPYHPTYLYGLGVERLPVAGRIAWGHRGHLDGFWSTMAYFPDTHLTVAMTVNADWPNPLNTLGAMVTALGE
jgi:D-alanyl-D-alanine carboxypeptidase